MGDAADPRVALRHAYNGCVDLLKAFRDKHIMIVTRYIITQAKNGPSIIVRPASPVSSHYIPRAEQSQALTQALAHPPCGGRLGGDSLPADPTMYPQTNTGASHVAPKGAGAGCPAAAASTGTSTSPLAKGRLARKIDDNSVVRGTGGTDAIQFLKQVRNETAHTKL
ncbi:tryptophan 2,3- dioxygenase [Coemansia furcata]|uniref:Tryptophan 2,3- dioxygenase n=1 Tax=Coemansia furcata TaxID=417177 RepID=A0ACC1L1C0_9FUNG|nr:tryptophan 2,3- dioxygenase [Coemansia furcata]